MRVLVSLASTIALALMFSACGGSKKEDTTPAAETAPPAEEEAAPAEGEGAMPAEGEGEQAPAEEAPAGQEQGGGGGW